MSIAAQAPSDFQFRPGDTVPTRTQKLEIIRRALANLLIPGDEGGIPDHNHTIAQVIGLQDILDSLRADQGYYRVGAFLVEPASSLETMFIHVVTEDIEVPANFVDAEGFVGIVPAAPMEFTIWKNPTFTGTSINGGEQIGTMTIDTDGSFTFATTSGLSYRLYKGDTMGVKAPLTEDAAAAGSFTFRLLVGFAKALLLLSGDMQDDTNDALLLSGDMQGTGLDRLLYSGDMIDG